MTKEQEALIISLLHELNKSLVDVMNLQKILIGELQKAMRER